jgi:ornithine cyclodeaminase
VGEVVAGRKPGRERDDETILFWHRGLSLSDIALSHAMLKADRLGNGHRLRGRSAQPWRTSLGSP